MRFRCLVNALLFALILIASLRASFAIINGETLQWNSNAYLVKILSKGEAVKNCVGSLITSSLVVTAPECVKNETTHEKLEDFIVVVSQLPNNERDGSRKIYEGRLVEAAARWSMLKIQPLDVSEICPPPPAAKRVAHLPLNPSLTNAANIRINTGALSESNCYMLGFNTVENGANFLETAELTRLSLERLYDEDAKEKVGLYTARIVNNSTACFDDMGAALICHVAEREEDYLVGMFRFLNFYEGVELDRSTLAYCTQAVQMVFDAFVADENLLQAIQRHDYGGFFDVYEKCEFTEI